MKDSITTGQLVQEFGVTPNTVRNWCREFAAYLSPSANPTSKQQRRFAARDVEVLREVHRLRNGAKPATQQEIDEALAGLHFGEIDTEHAATPEADPEQPTALVSQAHLEALTMLLQRETQRADEAQRRIEELQREMGRLEGQRRKPPRWWAFLFGGTDT